MLIKQIIIYSYILISITTLGIIINNLLEYRLRARKEKLKLKNKKSFLRGLFDVFLLVLISFLPMINIIIFFTSLSVSQDIERKNKEEFMEYFNLVEEEQE